MRAGQALRGVRETQGLELAAIAGELRIREPYLMAIERMEPGAMPSGYLTPYLRAYAVRLGLPGDAVVEAYTEQCGAVSKVSAPERIKLPAEPAAPNWKLRAVLAAVTVVAVGAIAGVAFLAVSDQPQAQRGPVSDALNGARESLFAAAPLPETVTEMSLPLTLVAVRDSWIDIRGADGTLYRSRVMHRGEVYMPRIGAGWTVSVRDGSAFEWHVGDVVIGPVGPEATPVYAASVDAAAARAAEIAAPAMAAAGGGQPSR